MLPNLVIIGARKCGTTSLHRYLSLHPAVWMSEQKEFGLFTRLGLFTRRDWRSRIDWYERQFPEPRPIRGEATPAYSTVSTLPCERMHELTPGRTSSTLSEIRSSGSRRSGCNGTRLRSTWRRSRSTAGTPASRWRRPADMERSAQRLCRAEPLRDAAGAVPALLPRRADLVIDQSELRGQRAQVMAEVFAFLGVDASFESPGFAAELNPGRVKRRFRQRDSRFRRAVLSAGGARIPVALRRPVAVRLRNAVTEPVRRPEFPASISPGLTQLLHDEAERLRALTGKSFRTWSV